MWSMTPEEILKKEAAALAEHLSDAYAVNRAREYRPILGLSYQCPSCWVVNGVKADMGPILDVSGADMLKCKNCGSAVDVSF